MGTAADIEAQRFPRKWLLENSLAEIAREEKPVAPASSHCSEKPRLGDAQILSLVDDSEIIGAVNLSG